MAKCRVLAFLLCENATKDCDGKVTLQGLFDRIVVPRARTNEKNFFVYYKIFIEEPCSVTLRINDPVLPGAPKVMNWRDSFSQSGPVQGVWALGTGRFAPGVYGFELVQVVENSEPISLAAMQFVVDQQEE